MISLGNSIKLNRSRLSSRHIYLKKDKVIIFINIILSMIKDRLVIDLKDISLVDTLLNIDTAKNVVFIYEKYFILKGHITEDILICSNLINYKNVEINILFIEEVIDKIRVSQPMLFEENFKNFKRLEEAFIFKTLNLLKKLQFKEEFCDFFEIVRLPDIYYSKLLAYQRNIISHNIEFFDFTKYSKYINSFLVLKSNNSYMISNYLVREKFQNIELNLFNDIDYKELSETQSKTLFNFFLVPYLEIIQVENGFTNLKMITFENYFKSLFTNILDLNYMVSVFKNINSLNKNNI